MSPDQGLRVLVTLESTCPNDSVLRTVSELLGSDRLELTGLYVEDADLLRAASLPGLTEISMSGQVSSLDAARISADIAAQATAARQAFEGLTRRLSREHQHVGHRFLVARGQIDEEFDRAAAQCDFVMVTRAQLATGLRPRLGHSFARLVRQPKHLLFVNEPWASGSSVVVLHGSDLALGYAARLARAEGLRLVVAAPASALPIPSDRLPEGTTTRQVDDWSESSIAELCLSENARLLVLPALKDLDWAELLVSLMDKLPCSLLKLV
jgi:hypothetical protein